MVENGNLAAGETVTLSRAPRSYPAFFKALLDPAPRPLSRRRSRHVTNKTCGLQSESERISKRRSLTPTISSSSCPTPFHKRAITMNYVATSMAHGISSNLAGITNDRDSFMQSGSITVSGIFRAKGNEAPMVLHRQRRLLCVRA